MIIIFQCYGGTHTSVTAASIYTGLLPRGRRPTDRELIALPYFDRLCKSKIGYLHYIGADRQGHRVFTLGSGSWGLQVRAIITAYLSHVQPSGLRVALIDCSGSLTMPIRLGGFLSRRLGLVAVGRPLVSFGIRTAYRSLLSRVSDFENNPAAYIVN
ncbi:MAG: DUF3189 family protein [Bacillota bacterium]